jgi:transcriptional regulator with XRE-family HTH domain
MTPEPLASLRAMGLTQDELAQLLGVGQSTISQWNTGERALPQPALEDLWELLRLVEERTAGGMDVHQAVEGWQPTVRLSSGRQAIVGAAVPVPMEAAKIASKEGPEGTERLVREATIAALVRAMEAPHTAEQWAYIRRLALTVKMFADDALLFKEWEGPHAD